MKGLRSIPRILKIHEVNGYKVSCLFNNGESRIIDFMDLFKNKFKVKPGRPAYKLMEDIDEFNQIGIIGTTIGWKNTGIYSEDEEGNPVFDHYDLDPIILYKNSQKDSARDLVIGMMIRKARKEAGLTQDELAKKTLPRSSKFPNGAIRM